ncbi:M3 family oligoendopeptidase, partial [Bacillus pseudomycoides]|nr:M3 family oligoendopeptidase [Bacillus pseudomycoides]
LDELDAYYVKELFALAECNAKTYSDEFVKDLQLENKLSSQYTQLFAAATIAFEGEERTLSQLVPFMQHTDRDMRKRASEAYYGFLEEHEEELDSMY